jgi:hypothetical protein
MNAQSRSRVDSDSQLLPGMKLLVVEDEALIAMEVEEIVAALGAEVVGSFSRVTDALEALERETVAGAILDIPNWGIVARPPQGKPPSTRPVHQSQCPQPGGVGVPPSPACVATCDPTDAVGLSSVMVPRRCVQPNSRLENEARCRVFQPPGEDF